MSCEPAAVVQERVTIEALEDRLRDFLGTANAQALAERLLPARTVEDRPHLDGFYWLLFAEWMAEDGGLTRTSAGRALLADLLWCQYCVYCLFRVQDDLFDAESEDLRLVIESNHLLLEATRCAALHFEAKSPFWQVFHGAIGTTASRIVEVDSAQRSEIRSEQHEVELYRELSACLGIAVAGVLIAVGKSETWASRVGPALGHVASALQILDDLGDLDEDLEHDRINFAGWVLSRPIRSESREAMRSIFAYSILSGDRAQGLFARVRFELLSALRHFEAIEATRPMEMVRKFCHQVASIWCRIGAEDNLVAGAR